MIRIKNPVLAIEISKTFETLGNYGYAKDKKYVYNFGEILKGENPKTFVAPPIPHIDY